MRVPVRPAASSRFRPPRSLWRQLLAGGLLACGLATGGWLTNVARSEDKTTDKSLVEEARKTFESLRGETAKTSEKAAPELVELGRKLFFDPRISTDGVRSCMLCHQPSLYGTDALPTARGVQNQVLPRNAPTILNSSLNFRIHWDGVFDDVEAQARGALTGPAFGNHDNAAAVARMKSVPGYDELFRKVFPKSDDPITVENWGTAIGAYERTLLTPSRFDDYLDGKAEALTAAEQRGLKLFLKTGCADCHGGAGVGGGSYEKFGVVSDYWKETHSEKIDKGRFGRTMKEEDLYLFKVPVLRNVAKTPPYFHDGSVKTLPEAVRVMATVQLGVSLSRSDTEDLTAFLESLTGELPKSFSEAPVLPSAGSVPSP